MNFNLNSIAFKIYLVIIISIIIFTLISAQIVISRSNDLSSAQYKEVVKNILDTTIINYERFINRTKINIESLATYPEMVTALTSADNRPAIDKISIFRELSFDLFESAGLMDLNCVLKAINKESIALIGRDFSFRDYCQGVLKARQTYFSDVIVSAATGNLVLTITVPVWDRGEMIGFVIGGINLSGLLERLSSNYDFTSGFLVILDKDNQVFFDSRRGGIVKEINHFEVFNDSIIDSVNLKIIEGLEEGYLESGGQKGDGHLVIFKRNLEFPATFLVGEPLTSVFALGKNISKTVIWVNSILTLMVVLMVLFIMNIFGARLKKIVELINNISFYSLDFSLSERDLGSRDEFGSIFRAFNNMKIKLKEAYSNLESANKELKTNNENIKIANQQLVVSENNLKEKNRELEIFNKSAIGRELKMIELKQEIETLKKKVLE